MALCGLLHDSAGDAQLSLQVQHAHQLPQARHCSFSPCLIIPASTQQQHMQILQDAHSPHSCKCTSRKWALPTNLAPSPTCPYIHSNEEPSPINRSIVCTHAKQQESRRGTSRHAPTAMHLNSCCKPFRWPAATQQQDMHPKPCIYTAAAKQPLRGAVACCYTCCNSSKTCTHSHALKQLLPNNLSGGLLLHML
jgi:hypothetical protein